LLSAVDEEHLNKFYLMKVICLLVVRKFCGAFKENLHVIYISNSKRSNFHSKHTLFRFFLDRMPCFRLRCRITRGPNVGNSNLTFTQRSHRLCWKEKHFNQVVLGLNGGRIIRGRIIPFNTVSYDEGVITTCIIGKISLKLVK
jgi:hypothetical protein